MKLFYLFFCLFPFALWSQEKDNSNEYYDTNYFEDQFYIGVQYNLLSNTSSGVDNTGIPYSFGIGFIKDFPINTERNIGFGAGIGYSYDVLKPNIIIMSSGDDFTHTVGDEFSSYDYTSHNLEFPIEFRWRTSSPTHNPFWRIYTGASYILNISNKTTLEGNNTTYEHQDLHTINYNNFSLYASLGFGTWNFHIKYYLKPIFKNNVRNEDNQPIEANQLKVGIMFYLL